MLAGILGSNTGANLVSKFVLVYFLEVILGLCFGLAKRFEPDSRSPCHGDQCFANVLYWITVADWIAILNIVIILCWAGGRRALYREAKET